MSQPGTLRSAGLAVIVYGSLGAGSAYGFTFGSEISDGCHERITAEMLVGRAWPDGQQPPALSALDLRILEDLPFALDERVQDPFGLALLIGVRHNDLHEASPFD